ncbi:MAG: hypothetical protein Q9187_005912 [Circinaria calcarea]
MAESTQVPLSPLEQTDSLLQTRWNKIMQNDPKFAGPYQNVAVLLISWADELDDLQCDEEVKKLQKVFQRKYNYTVSRLVIGREKAPQHQVNFKMAQFLLDQDGQSSLLIVYYAGHGMPGNTPGQLKLIGKRDPDDQRLEDIEVTWNLMEGQLQSARSDVFVIFDCCFASHLARNPHLSTRSYEFLSPNHLGPLTSIPGPSSFTSCLIWALRKLAKECKNGFNTQQLRTRIIQAPKWPKSQSPLLYEPYGLSVARIFLAPLPKNGSQAAKEQQVPHWPATNHVSLELRVLFDCTPNEDDIILLAENWSRFMRHHLPKAQTIRWGGLRQGSQGMIAAINRFMQIKQQVRERQELLAPLTGAPTVGLSEWHSKAQLSSDPSMSDESDMQITPQKESSEAVLYAAQSASNPQTQPQPSLTVDIPSPGLKQNVTAVRDQNRQPSSTIFRKGPKLINPKERDTVFVKRLKVADDKGFKKMTSTWDGPYILSRIIRRQRYALLTDLHYQQVVGQYPIKHLRIAYRQSSSGSETD